MQLRIARDVTFRAGYTTTAFLVEHENFMAPDPTGEPDEAFLLAVGAVLDDERAWRIGEVGIPVRLRGRQRHVAIVASRAERTGSWQLAGDLAGELSFEVSGERITARSAEARCAGRAVVGPAGVEVSFDGERFALAFEPPPQLGTRGAGAAAHGSITAPMPGKIVSVAVKAGDRVAERDLLVVLEAMKMEHRIEASRSGVVKAVAVAAGALVSGGATLVEFE